MSDPKKILVVEDEESIRTLYVTELKKAGFAVDSVGLAKDALTNAFATHYDLILLDIMLPDSNGMEVLRQVREKIGPDQTKIMMLTNIGQDDIIQDSYNMGANGYLIKAASEPSQLIEEIKNLFNLAPTSGISAT